MGEFQEIAEELAGIIDGFKENEKGISRDDIPNIVERVVGHRIGEINCYPGIPGFSCCDMAVFVSVNSPSYTKGRQGHLKCNKALAKIIQHMQGTCIGITKRAVLLTDSWDHAAYDEWRANLRNINANAQLEVYLMTGRNITPIQL